LCTSEIFWLTNDKCHVLLAINLMLVAKCSERTKVRRQPGFHEAAHLSLIVAAPLNELLDGDHLQIVLIRKTSQLFRARHRGRVFFRDDLTQHTGWTQSRQTR